MKMKKRFRMILGSIILASTVSLTMPALAAQPEIVCGDNNEIQPRTDIKEWRFKIENGNLYKRLYNYSTGPWETDWIFVMSGVTEL